MSCTTDYTDWTSVGDYRYQLDTLAALPTELTECSGLCYYSESLYAINDGGNSPTIYELSEDGSLLTSIVNPTLSNIDWEAIAADDDGLVIADTGNNSGQRTTQTLYQIDPQEATMAAVVDYSYPDQVLATDMDHNYDCEALVIVDGHYCLWTKNRGNDQSYLYTAPLGTSNFTLSDSITVPAMVTDATYDPSTGSYILLCNQLLGTTHVTYIVILELNTDRWDISRKADILLSIDDKVEAITWSEKERYLLASERGTLGQGLLYELRLAAM